MANGHTPEELPEDFEFFKLQIAGHHYLKGKDERLSKCPKHAMCSLFYECVLKQHSTGLVLKPEQNPPRGETEIAFYESVTKASKNGHSASDETNNILRDLHPHIPHYFGTLHVPVSGNDHRFLKLENLTAKFSKPSALDVKIGAQTWDPKASKEKIAHELKKHPLSHKAGFRLLGMMVYDSDKDSYVIKDKHWGRLLKDSDMHPAFNLFFTSQSKDYVRSLTQKLLERLLLILEWFERQKLVHIYASSILVVYEGKPTQISDVSNSFDLRMIDFTHVFPSDKTDLNYIHGLKNFIKVLKSFLVSLAH